MVGLSPKEALRVGMAARVELQVGKRRSAVVIPKGAVQGPAREPYVFIVGEGGVYERRRVTIGHEDGDRVEITKGLKAGEKALSRPQ